MTALPNSSDLTPDQAALASWLAETIGESIHLCSIFPDSNTTAGHHFGTDAAKAAEWAIAENLRGKGVYWSVNRVREGVHKKPAKADLIEARFAHCDIDPPKDGSPWDKRGKVAQLEAYKFPPSFIIDSGNGLGAFWRFDEPMRNVDAIEAINNALIADFGAGPGTWNVDRLMRLPFTINWPNKVKVAAGCVKVLSGVITPDDGTVHAPHAFSQKPPKKNDTPPPADTGGQMLLTSADLKRGNVEKLRRMIDQPSEYFSSGKSRSEWAFGIGCEMAQQGYNDAEIIAILMNPSNAGAAHVVDQPDCLRAAQRVLAEAARNQVSQTAAPVLTILDPSKWHGEAPPAREWSVTEWIPLRQATYLTGKGSAGKSLLAQQLATCISLGLPFLGQRTKEAPAFYITAEDDPDELWRRQAAICRSLNITLSALRDRLHLVSLAGEVGNELVTFDERGKLRIEPRFQQIEAAVAGHAGAFIALDNVAHFTADEIKRSSVAGFMSMLNRLAMGVDGSVLILGHPNKIGAEFSGSTAWENQVRSRLYLETPTDADGAMIDRDARVLTRSKSNYARNGEQITFRWHEWAFVRDDDLPAHIRQNIADTVTAGAENAAFLECLAVCTEKQRAVSHVPGVNYAPTVFSTMPEAKRYSKGKLEGAMNRLWNMGVIAFDQQLWTDKHRHWKQGIAKVEKCGDPPAGTPCGDPDLSDCNSLREPCGGDPPYTTYNGAPSHEVDAPSSFEESETDFAADDGVEF